MNEAYLVTYLPQLILIYSHSGRITFRFLGNLSQRWLSAPNQSGRQSLIEEITDVMAGTKTMGGFTTRLVGLATPNPGNPIG